MFGNIKLNKKIAELTIENTRLKKDNEKMRIENAALRKENNELKQEMQQMMSNLDQRIAEAVEAAVAPLRAEIAKKDAEIEKLENEIIRLKGIINKDSSNSSKPPSQNGYKKVPNTREKSDRPSGGVPGHQGHRLQLPKNMKELVEQGKAEIEVIDYTNGSQKYVSRWEIDLKVVTVFREYRYELGAELPTEHYNEVSYGTNLKTLTILLSNEGIIAEERLKELYKSITHGIIEISDGTIDKIIKQFSEKLDGELDRIREDLLNGNVMNTDDTPMKSTQRAVYGVDGKETGVETAERTTYNVCVRTHSNEQSTLYTVNPKKDKLGIERDGILPKYIGSIVHDHEKKFYGYGSGHGTCVGHLVRELTGLHETQNRLFKKEAHSTAWAAEMRGLLSEMNRHKNNDIAQGKKKCDGEKLSEYINSYDKMLAEGWEDLASQNKNTPGYDTFRVLLKRMQEYKESYLLFMKNYEIPFTNNLSERDLRACKTKQKVSGCFRSWEGICRYVRIRSFVSTLKKRSIDLYDAINLVWLGQPVLD